MASVFHVNIVVAFIMVYAIFCKFLATFPFDVSTHLKKISDDAKVDDTNKATARNRSLWIIKILTETMDFHGKSIQLSFLWFW